METIFPAISEARSPSESTKRLRRTQYAGASWRKMLLCQPPVFELCVGRCSGLGYVGIEEVRPACVTSAESIPMVLDRRQAGTTFDPTLVVSMDGLRMVDLAGEAGRVSRARYNARASLRASSIWYWKRVGDKLTAASLPGLLKGLGQ